MAHTFLAYIREYPPPPTPREAKNALQIMSLTAYTTWTNERKEKPSEWLTFSKLSHFSKESHWRRVGFPLTEHFRTSLELFGTSLDILNMSKDVPTNFVLLWDPYEKSWHSQDKNDMSINLKKLAVDVCIHWFHFYFPVSDTRRQKFSISQLCSMSPMLRNTMASRNTFSSRTETRILNLYIKVILLSHFCSI